MLEQPKEKWILGINKQNLLLSFRIVLEGLSNRIGVWEYNTYGKGTEKQFCIAPLIGHSSCIAVEAFVLQHNCLFQPQNLKCIECESVWKNFFDQLSPMTKKEISWFIAKFFIEIEIEMTMDHSKMKELRDCGEICFGLFVWA